MFTEIGLGVRAVVDGRLVEVGTAYIGGGTLSVPAPLRVHLERIKGAGATPLVVYQDRQPLGILSVADHVRPDAGATVRRLRSLDIGRLAILSGDHDRAARLVADGAGVTEVWSELKPPDKVRVVQDLQGQGHTVMFVGDGINDAPALATANVGVAMASAGTDVALETADIALMHDDLSKLPFLVRLGRKTIRVIKWNIGFGVAFNALAVLASGSGYLTPIMGAVVHNIGSVVVVMIAASLAFIPE
jgi:Cd2+/Zn2+-exporting ATPase